MSDVYAGVGADLLHFRLDVEAATLERCDSYPMPGQVQYAWGHGSLPVLYVASAYRDPTHPGERYFVSALIRDQKGDLSPLGAPAVLASRPIHLTTDADDRHLLVLHNQPAALSVRELAPDGTIGATVAQPGSVATDPYPHQVRVAPSDRRAIVVARGTAAEPAGARKGAKPADPGRLRLLDYDRGRLANRYDVEPDARFGLGSFQARHLDFHPRLPLVYVTVEAQNQLTGLRFEGDELGSQPLFVADLLADQANPRPRQMAGALHVHPSGRFLYVANRADAPEGFAGGEPAGPKWEVPKELPVFAGGENTIAAFRLDPATGEPTLIGIYDTRGFCPRTFGLDPGGRMLVVGNMKPMKVRTKGQGGDGSSGRSSGGVVTVPASLALFRIGDDGGLVFAAKLDLPAGRSTMEWIGVL